MLYLPNIMLTLTALIGPKLHEAWQPLPEVHNARNNWQAAAMIASPYKHAIWRPDDVQLHQPLCASLQLGKGRVSLGSCKPSPATASVIQIQALTEEGLEDLTVQAGRSNHCIHIHRLAKASAEAVQPKPGGLSARWLSDQLLKHHA